MTDEAGVRFAGRRGRTGRRRAGVFPFPITPSLIGLLLARSEDGFEKCASLSVRLCRVATCNGQANTDSAECTEYYLL